MPGPGAVAPRVPARFMVTIEGARVEPLAPDDPREIGPYLLQGRLGTGGMGQVYLGRTADAVPAAVKVVHSRFAADPSFRQRFAREIAVARSVRGPWVAALLDGDAQAHRPWLATEYVAAPPLDRVVDDDGPLPEPALVALAHRLAEALAQLHAQGVVHRDLKPSNVLVADDGPRLIDFGVARALDATVITQTGMIVGTPAFMSPEQAAGAEIGPPSDVFSLASVLVYAGTGRGPFGHTANALAMLRRISDDQPDLDGLPGRLREVLEPCFAKDPAERPSASEIAGRLAGQPMPVTAGAGRGGTRTLEPSPPEPADAAPRRMRRRALLIGGVLAAGAVVGGAVLAFRTPSRPVRWATSADRGAVAVAASGNDVYMVDKFGLVHAFDPEDGAMRWTFQLPGSVRELSTTLQAVAGTCYVDTPDAGLYALDAASGQPRWTDGTAGASLLLATGELVVRSALEDVPAGVVHTPYDGVIGPLPVTDTVWNVQGLDPASGAMRWSFQLDQDESAQDGALAAAGQVHIRTESRILTLDAATGTRRSARPRPALHFTWSASRAGLFYATWTETVRLDTTTGDVLWNRPLPAPPNGSQEPPSLLCTDESMFLASMYGHEAWDAITGEQQWYVDQHGFDLTGSAAEWTISTFDGQIGTSDGVILIEMGSDGKGGMPRRVSARSARNGATLWTTPLDGIGPGRIHMALGTDTLYVLAPGADDATAVVHAIPVA